MVSFTRHSYNAPTRMLVERSVYDQAVNFAKAVTERAAVAQPSIDGDHIGKLASDIKFNKMQLMIEKGIAEGTRLIAGGSGRPDGFDKGSFVKPTIFTDVQNDMAIAREGDRYGLDDFTQV